MDIPKIIVSTEDFLKHKEAIQYDYYELSKEEKDTPRGWTLDTLFQTLEYTPTKFLGANFILLSSLDPWLTAHYKAVKKWLDKNEVRYSSRKL